MANKDAVLERVNAAKARLAAARAQAKQEADDERLLAEYEADEEAKARAQHLDSLLSDFKAKSDAYAKVRDEALGEAVKYYRCAQAAVAAHNEVEAARSALRSVLAPQGFGGDPAELELYDPVLPHAALAVLHAGVASDPFQAEHGVNSVELDQLRGIVSSLPY